MKITVISTSPRQNSGSLRLAKMFASKLESKTGSTVRCVNMEDCDIPMIGRGALDAESLTAFQQEFLGAWGEADLVIFTIPEYNFSTGGEFINALHQLTGAAFAHLFDGKVFALAGVSAGRGGRLPALDIGVILSKNISFLNKYSIVSPKFFESHETQQNIDTEGQSMGNEFYDSTVDKFLDYTLTIAGQWHR